MIELQQLKQLITIVDEGTISKAAEKLFLSQPALSRSMQKFEEELGVELFKRQKNKVILNDTGKLAVEYARKLLDDFNVYLQNLKSFDRKNHTITIGSCAPAPLWKLSSEIYSSFPDKTITTEIKEIETLKIGLLDGTYQAIILNENLCTDDYVSKEYCKEQLKLFIPKQHPLSKKADGVTFEDLKGLTMLLYSDIGFWKNIHKKMTETYFIIQNNRRNFIDLIRESLLPSFSSNLVEKAEGIPENRITIPFFEEETIQTFYIVVLKKNKNFLLNI